MIRTLALVGAAYRLARCFRLLRAGRLAECGRTLRAVERDFPELRAARP